MATANEEMSSLVEALGDKGTFAAGWRALQEAGDAAIPAVREGLSHPNPRVRQFCAGFIDAHWDESALQRLILSLHDPKLKVRKAAVHSLGCDRCKGGQNPIDVLPHLEERIREDKSIKVRRMAVQTLAAQTPNKLIARVLRRVLRDESDPRIRRFAEWGVARYEKARLGRGSVDNEE
jgi:HEAT repeat protein